MSIDFLHLPKKVSQHILTTIAHAEYLEWAKRWWVGNCQQQRQLLLSIVPEHFLINLIELGRNNTIY